MQVPHPTSPAGSGRRIGAHLSSAVAALVSLVLACAPVVWSGCEQAATINNVPETHPLEPHFLWPTVWPGEGQIANGVFTGEALDQPIAFPHSTHVTTLNMDCQYCHFVARKSIHAGVPPTQTCMGCHKYAMKDRPEVQKLAALWEQGTPTPWNKVHDLPDHVVFSHKRHVKAGVNCTECHGQMGLQGQVETVRVETVGPDGQTVWEDQTGVHSVNIRETSLQMGWCLQCHATHPSIDTNYGEKSDQRRAELKDCWTCHK